MSQSSGVSIWVIGNINVIIWLGANFSFPFSVIIYVYWPSGWPVLTDLSRLPFYDYPVPGVLSKLTCSSCRVLAILSSHSCPGWPVQVYLSGCPLQADLSWLSCPRCPVLAVPSWLSCSVCPMLVVLSQLSLACPSCPFLAVWIFCENLKTIFVFTKIFANFCVWDFRENEISRELEKEFCFDPIKKSTTANFK